MKADFIAKLKKEKSHSFHEKCGVVGVYSENNLAPSLAKRALSSLQHRGQESAGITIWKGKNKFKTHLGMGLIPHVLNAEVIKKLGKSTRAIAHNRYSTSGSSHLLNAQPITLKKGKYSISIAHNGNIPDLKLIKKQLHEKPEATSDTAYVAAYLLQERPCYASWEETLEKCMPFIHGAYCFVILTDDGDLFGVRDVFGIRPFCLGRLKNGWVIASESVALDVIGASFVREIARGEILTIRANHLNSTFFGKALRARFDLFENVYFARPDSFINGGRVREGRENSGRLLAQRLQKKNIPIDVIIPVFDSGYAAAKGVALELGIPILEAITTSHYVGRTFIQPGQENRAAAVNGKHNFTPDELQGKNVVVIDDSAVRLTTSKVIVEGLKECGVNQVHAAFASPPVVNYCDMGIDMKSKKELPASRWEHEPLSILEQNIASFIQADSVTYLPIDETCAANGRTRDDFYWYPFSGPHPIRSKTVSFKKRKKSRADTAKLLIFISGNGTNMENIVREIEQGRLNAEVSGVICNDEGASGMNLSSAHNLKTILISSKGKLKIPKKRMEYEKKLFIEIEKANPDLLVLSGWSILLSDEFIKRVTERGIAVINLHPALLPGMSSPLGHAQTGYAFGNRDNGQKTAESNIRNESVMTSRGRIPVIRGMLSSVLHEVRKKKLPLSGVTVHQVLPGRFDSGPVILTEEVRCRMGESPEDFEKRIHEAEYRVFPAALKRVIHSMLCNNIDISKGAYPW